MKLNKKAIMATAPQYLLTAALSGLLGYSFSEPGYMPITFGEHVYWINSKTGEHCRTPIVLDDEPPFHTRCEVGQEL